LSNVIKFAHQRKTAIEVREQACIWLVRIESGLSEEETSQLHTWFKEKPEHIQVLIDSAHMWDQASVLSELAEIFPLEQYIQPKRQLTRHFYWGAVTAALLCVGLFVGSSQISRLEAFFERKNMVSSYGTEIGEQKTIDLIDGSQIILNTDTRIEVIFTEDERKVVLHEGEGHFTVAKDASRPFRVYAGVGYVEAVGTAFAVQHLFEKSVEVTVEEGRVNFKPIKPIVEYSASIKSLMEREALDSQGSSESLLGQDDGVPLAAGETVKVDVEDESFERRSIQPNEMENRLIWRRGMLLFQGNSLEEVIREVSRYTSITFEVDDSVKDIQVVGIFETGDIEGLLLTMSRTFGVSIEKLDEEHIRLIPQ